MATVSNIDIDVRPPGERDPPGGDPPQIAAPPNARPRHDPAEEEGGGKGKGNAPPLPPPRKLLSDVRNRGGEDGGRRSNGPTAQRVRTQAALKLRTAEDYDRSQTVRRDVRDDTVKDDTVRDDDTVKDDTVKDDTMELLKDVVLESPAPVPSGGDTDVSGGLRGKADAESVGRTLAANVDCKDDTTNLLKDVSSQDLSSDARDNLESTEKLLEPQLPVVTLESCDITALSPVPERDTPPPRPASSSTEPSVSRQRRQKDKGSRVAKTAAAPRPLPLPPVSAMATEGKRRGSNHRDDPSPTQSASSTASVGSSQDRHAPLPQGRPLTARERRRLRQSHDTPGQSAVHAVRRASYDVGSSNSKPSKKNSVTRSASDLTKESIKADDLLNQPLDEDECSSSTSSTDRSEGDCIEGKCESNDMQDLVQMMTQTLRMDVREADGCRSGSAALPEFRLNRKYRDTLVLHGKSREEQEEFHFSELPTGTSGPAKIRRAIEHLRTDVLKGLGVKQLDRVLDIMEQDDEDQRELLLREEMGEQKYLSYAVMVRQLKFFEDVVFKG